MSPEKALRKILKNFYWNYEELDLILFIKAH